jgi:hypothetical protein
MECVRRMLSLVAEANIPEHFDLIKARQYQKTCGALLLSVHVDG